MSCKITLIGAGSVVFAKTLISDVLQFPELSDVTLCLMDIDPARLEVADVMMKRIVAKLGVKAKVESTLNQRKAIRGAKYVICTIQVGGFKPSTVVDFEIPKKYGLRQTIADTLGVGGVFRGLRTIPVINSIARDIADHAHPECLFLNYTNPMAMNCWAVDRGVGIPHVGLCHSVFGTARMLAGYAGVPYDDVSYLAAGVNHMAFFLQFKYKGQDAYPLLFKALEDPKRDTELVRFEMMRRLGYFVTESSEHQSEYTPYFIHHGGEVVEKFKIPLDEYIRRCEAIIATWNEEETRLLGNGKDDITVAPQSHEYGSYIIHSIETNTLRTVYGNIPNRNIIDNLRPGCCVEVPCQVDGTGLNPVRVGDLPPQLAAICSTQIGVQELTVEAALTHKREHIYHAVMADPHTAATLTLDKIWAMCDELIEVHQKDGYLGEFAPTAANTGRSFTGIGDRIIATLKGEGSFDPAEGAKNTLSLTVENPSSTAVKTTLEAACEPSELIVNGKTKWTFAVPAGKSKQIRFTCRNQKALPEGACVRLLGNDPQILRLDAQLRARRVYKADDQGVVHCELQLNGFKAVETQCTRKGDTLQLNMRVIDSDIDPNVKVPHKGSVIEFFVSPEGSSKIKQLFLVPQKGKAGLLVVDATHNNAKIPAKVSAYKVSKIDYSFTVNLPMTALGLDAQQSRFYFDIIAKINALGDAHSGGRTSLSGSFESHADNSNFAVLDFS